MLSLRVISRLKDWWKRKGRREGGKKVALVDIANTIAQIEGFFVPNSLAQRNNNPGNLIFVGQAGATLGEKGFAKFSSPDAGMQALQNQIALDASRGLDVTGFLNKYAPPSENDTNNYINLFTSKLGVSASDRLSDIIGDMGIDVNNQQAGMVTEDGGISLVLGVAVVAGIAYILLGRIGR